MVAYYAESQNLPSVTPDSTVRFTQKVDQFVVQYPAAKEDPLYPDIIRNISQVMGSIHIYINDEWGDVIRVEFWKRIIMVILNTIQVVLLCIACISFGFAVGYTLKATVMKDK